MLVWQDMPSGGSRDFASLRNTAPVIFGSNSGDGNYSASGRGSAESREEFIKEIGSMINCLYNVPCIAAWVPFNEGWGQFDAAKICDFIMSMENGYYTEVNERGSRLSAGQRQLISFARALLADPKILILDEATSSIDTETELLLQKGLNELLKGRTSFIIAHRLSTIKNASCIMYVDKGDILEKGTHEELLQLKGEYYQLYMSQFDFLK